MSDHRTTAAKLALGVAADADVHTARQAFLRQVQDCQGQPPALSVEALAELGVLTSSLPREQLQLRIEASLANEVEEFARQYWTLPPGERAKRWSELEQVGLGMPRLCTRLEMLERGLYLVPPVEGLQGLEAEIAALIVETYPLKPTEQGHRWRAWFDRIEKQSGVKAARENLQATHPAFVALGIRWLDPNSDTKGGNQFPALAPPPRVDGRTGERTRNWNRSVMYPIIFLVISFAIYSLIYDAKPSMPNYFNNRPRLYEPAPIEPIKPQPFELRFLRDAEKSKLLVVPKEPTMPVIPNLEVPKTNPPPP